MPYTRNSRLKQLHAELQLATPVVVKVVDRQAVAVVGPKLWNELSLSIRQLSSLPAFKTALTRRLLNKYPSH